MKQTYQNLPMLISAFNVLKLVQNTNLASSLIKIEEELIIAEGKTNAMKNLPEGDKELQEYKAHMSSLYNESMLKKDGEFLLNKDGKKIFDENSFRNAMEIYNSENPKILAKVNEHEKKFIEFLKEPLHISTISYLPDNLNLEQLQALKIFYKEQLKRV